MHNINTRNKKKHAIKLFSAYGLIAFVLAVMTYVLVLVAAGYDIDRTTGQVIQNGAILIESNPAEADVYIDGVRESDKTPSRLPLPQGSYDIRIEFEDYRPWQSQVEVDGSAVTWLYYPQLMPNVIETSIVGAVEGLRFFEANDESDQIALQTDKQVNRITLYNLNETELEAQQIVIPSKLFKLDDTGAIIGNLQFIEWSSDASYMLVKQVYQDAAQFILVDIRNPVQSKNLQQSLGFMIDQAFFGPRNNDVYIVHGGLLRSFNKSNGTASSLLFENVAEVGVEDKDVWILRTGDSEKQNGVFRLGQRDEPVISLEPEDRKSMLASNYESEPSIALIGDDVVQIFTDVRQNLELNVPEKIIRFSDPQAKIEFSTHGRFLSVTQSNKTLVYDLEDKREHDLTIESTGSLGWFDAQRLYYSKDSQLHIMDFNGSNIYQITRFDSDWPVHISEKQGSIYSIGRQSATDRLVLHRSVVSLEDPR